MILFLKTWKISNNLKWLSQLITQKAPTQSSNSFNTLIPFEIKGRHSNKLNLCLEYLIK